MTTLNLTEEKTVPEAFNIKLKIQENCAKHEIV
jgi:hypothetical protein